MKNPNALANNFTPFQSSESHLDAGVLKGSNSLSLQHFTVPTPMTEQEIAPPVHVWERIASILDDQDRQSNEAGILSSLSLTNNRKSLRRYALATTTAIVLAAIFWLIF